MNTSIFLSISQEHQRILILVKVIMAVSGTINSLDRTTTAFIVLYKNAFLMNLCHIPFNSSKAGKRTISFQDR
jgi:hypothetical protein